MLTERAIKRLRQVSEASATEKSWNRVALAWQDWLGATEQLSEAVKALEDAAPKDTRGMDALKNGLAAMAKGRVMFKQGVSMIRGSTEATEARATEVAEAEEPPVFTVFLYLRRGYGQNKEALRAFEKHLKARLGAEPELAKYAKSSSKYDLPQVTDYDYRSAGVELMISVGDNATQKDAPAIEKVLRQTISDAVMGWSGDSESLFRWSDSEYDAPGIDKDTYSPRDLELKQA